MLVFHLQKEIILHCIVYFQKMKLNWHTKIMGQGVILVPYCSHHVPKYHDWMKSEELQHLTGSEPLTLEEEFEMQKTWKESEDKCTFIILHRETLESTGSEIEAMIGDTNIFLREDDPKVVIGEAEIMIAELGFRGQKLGLEAIALMLLYGAQHLSILVFEVKIKLDNDKSIKLFEKLGFSETAKSEVFQETTMTVKVDKHLSDHLGKFASLNVHDYHHLV